MEKIFIYLFIIYLFIFCCYLWIPQQGNESLIEGVSTEINEHKIQQKIGKEKNVWLCCVNH